MGRAPGGGMWLSTAQSRKSRDTGKPGRKVAAREISEGQAPRQNMLSIWQNVRVNKKSSRTLHPAALTFSASPTTWDVKTQCASWETFLQWWWRVVVVPGCQGQASCLARTLWTPLEYQIWLGPGVLSPAPPPPPPPNTHTHHTHTSHFSAGDQGHQA